MSAGVVVHVYYTLCPNTRRLVTLGDCKSAHDAVLRKQNAVL